MPRHYMTPRGVAVLQAELKQLVELERPKTVNEVATAAAHGDRSENAEYKYGKLRLRDIDRRTRFLQKRLESVVVIEPKSQSGDAVHFGATVAVSDESGTISRYMIVGTDETDPSAGRISYESPLGRALLNRRVGELVIVKRPMGDVEVEIAGISYE
ncbi:MAG: transcription elongation factor GreB [Myxococcales bacterium]|nr:transcription elongation factor GreB [Myxococcales bacterium]